MNLTKDSALLPPITYEHRYASKDTTKSLFPKIGGMAVSAYIKNSPFSSMCQNRKILDNTLRDKVWTGEENKLQVLEVNPSNRSLDSTEVESKQLTNITNKRRIETIHTTKAKDKKKKNPNLFSNGRKSNDDNSKLLIVENEVLPKNQLKLKKDIFTKEANKMAKVAIKKSLHRYKNSSTIERYTKSIDEEDEHHFSKLSSNRRGVKEEEDQKLKRFTEVNASVNEHLRKYEYLIPDLRKKKFDLLTQILGEKSYEDIKVKLSQK